MHQDDPSASGQTAHQFEAGGPRRLLVRRLTVFCLSAGTLGFLAFDGAGYDVVVRQEVGLVAWALLAVGFALGVLPRARPPRSIYVALFCVVALVGWSCLSLLWTASAERTTAEIARLLTYTGLVALALCGLNRYTFRSAAAGLSVAALAIPMLAVATRLYPSLISGASDVSHAFHTDRLNYPLDYWNAVGVWSAMAVAIGLAWSAHARLPVIRALALAPVPISGLAVYLSYSRGGAIGVAVALVAVLAFSRNRWTAFLHSIAAGAGTALAIAVARDHHEIAHATGGAGGTAVLVALGVGALVCVIAAALTGVADLDRARLPRRTANWAVPGLIAVLLIAAVTFGHGPASRGWDQFQHQDEIASGPDPAERLTSTGGGRVHLWNTAIDAFEAHPLDGIGPGTYEYWWAEHGDRPGFVRDAHSLYLEQLAELGLPGIVLLLLVFGSLIWAALWGRKTLRESSDLGASAALTACFAVFAVTAGGDWMWEETAVGALALIALGVAAAGGSQRLPRATRSGRLARAGVRAGIVLVAVAAALVEVPGIVSTERTRASEQAAQDGDLSRARDLADAAVDAEPWAATPRLQLAQVLAQDGRLAEARRSVTQAEEKEPTNWRIPAFLAALDSQLGDRAAAKRDRRRARQLWPRSPFLNSAR